MRTLKLFGKRRNVGLCKLRLDLFVGVEVGVWDVGVDGDGRVKVRAVRTILGDWKFAAIIGDN